MKAGATEYYQNIIGFKKCFASKDALITLNGKTIPLQDCELLGDGHSKIVYGIKGEKTCFLIPNKSRNWDAEIEAEKALCDEINALGLRAQRYEIVPCQIQATPDGPKYTLNVMVTQRFDSLAQDESIAIYDPKNPAKYITGGPLWLYDGEAKNIGNPQWNRKIISQILKEYALALTYELPIHQVTQTDDSVHLYFKVASNQPPEAHFMFWDVLGDFSGVAKAPQVPSLETLKSGIHHPDSDNEGLVFLCNEIACACDPDERELIDKQLALGDVAGIRVVKTIETALLGCITDEMLLEALAHCQQHLDEKFGKKPHFLPGFESKAKPAEFSVLPVLKALFVSEGAQNFVMLIAANRQATQVLNSFSLQAAKELAARLHNPAILAQFKSLDAPGQAQCLSKLKGSFDALVARGDNISKNLAIK